MNALINMHLYLIIPGWRWLSRWAAISGKVMNNEPVFLLKILRPCERLLVFWASTRMKRWAGKNTLLVPLRFLYQSFVLTLILKFQDLPALEPPRAWRAEAGTLAFKHRLQLRHQYQLAVLFRGGHPLQLLPGHGLDRQNFVSAGAGIAVLFALIRGFVRTKASAIGNFWVDLTRSVLYADAPLSLVMSIALVGLGVPQSLGGNITVDLLEPLAVDAEGNVITGAEIDPEAGTVTLDGALVEDAQIITKQIVPLYPQASQIIPQTAGHQRRRHSGQQLRPSLGKPQPRLQSAGDDFPSANSRGPLLHLWAQYQG